MKNLYRALWMTLKYRWSLIGSFVCCLFVAVLWGANLGAVYPFVEIVLKGDTLHEWIDKQDHETLSAITTIEDQIATLTAQGLPDQNQSALAKLDSNLSTCLLYTSPSPRDATLSRMPSSA